MLFNVDFFFFDNQSYGWSERMFNSQSSIDGVPADITALLALRIAFLPTSMNVVYTRVSTPGKPPNSLLSAVSDADGKGTYEIVSGSITMPVDVRVLATLQASDVLKNRKFLGGLVSQDVSGDAFSPTDPWITAFDAWANSLLESNWVAATTYKVDETQESDPIQSVDYSNQVAYRKAGRPFGLRRGRRRTVH